MVELESSPTRVAKSFKKFDIRGSYRNGEINESVVEKIGFALVETYRPQEVAVGHDARVSSPELHAALVNGITESGVDVVDLGLIGTEEHWFASGKYNYDLSAMVTASHSPKEFNGLKIATAGAVAISGKTGIYKIRDTIFDSRWKPKHSEVKGKVISVDVTPAWVRHVLSFAKIDKIKRLRIGVDAGNGMACKLFPEVAKELPIEAYKLNFDLDGNFPGRGPDPSSPKDLEDLALIVGNNKLDFGIAFDGDADRAVFMDERGEVISATAMTAILARALLKEQPGAVIGMNPLIGREAVEEVKRRGGKILRVPVGHSVIKQEMRKHDAILASEHSGHYYFGRENYYADSSHIPFLLFAQIVSQDGRRVSEIAAEFEKYARSGELNFSFENINEQGVAIEEIKDKFSDAPESDEIDGISVEYPTWRMNVRESTNDPLLRINIEADNDLELREHVHEVIEYMKRKGANLEV